MSVAVGGVLFILTAKWEVEFSGSKRRQIDNVRVSWGRVIPSSTAEKMWPYSSVSRTNSANPHPSISQRYLVSQTSKAQFALTQKFRIIKHRNCTWFLTATAVAQWLRCCTTSRKVAGSIASGVSGFFIDIKSFRSHYGPVVDSASNRNEYQEHFLGVKAAGA